VTGVVVDDGWFSLLVLDPPLVFLPLQIWSLHTHTTPPLKLHTGAYNHENNEMKIMITRDEENLR
jgi:hypothetical protein